MIKSPLATERGEYSPQIPSLLKDLTQVIIELEERGTINESMREYFPQTLNQPFLRFVKGRAGKATPLRIGVLFSGGQAPGGHNVICALFDGALAWHKESHLFGFLNGPKGLIENHHLLITKEICERHRNLGGFDMIGSGRTKIETPAQFAAAGATCQELSLDGLVIIGGDDSNTNAGLLAENFISKGIKTKVIGVPKTIDGDLRNEQIEASFGFDTATKIYSELIGNLAKDALSIKKYIHFVKLMGRSASHVTVECALQTEPNLALVGEEIEAKKQTLGQVVQEIADLVEERSRAGKHYGVILVPEGLIEFIPEFRALIRELNTRKGEEKVVLSPTNQALFDFLPQLIQEQLLFDRDPHGNVQLSHIETEKLLIELTKKELRNRGFTSPFTPLSHFFGYEGRSAMPSNFDANYCAALGYSALCLIRDGYSGYVVSITGLAAPVEQWKIGGVPLVSMMHLEERKGKQQCVIAKRLVELDEPLFQLFAKKRKGWRLDDHYPSPGPLQFYGKSADAITQTLLYSAEKRLLRT